MVLNTDELERLAEDIMLDRLITGDLYCAECGYNLRTLPRRGRCPECGSDYNTRTVLLEGVFAAGMLEFPASEVFGAALTVGLAGLFMAWGIRPVVAWRLMFAAVFALLAVFYLGPAWKSLARYARFRGIVRRIKRGDEW